MRPPATSTGRGVGDIQTLTIDEYRARPWWGRLGYRLFRNPFVMFGLGPLWVVLIGPATRHARDAPETSAQRARDRPRARRAASGASAWLVGWQEFLLVLVPPLLLTGAAGIWLFYVQHQFEDAYWQTKRRVELRRRGAPGQLVPEAPADPPVLHREHRAPPRPPPERADPELQPAGRPRGGAISESVPTLSLLDGLRAVRLKLWDAEQRRLVTFREAGRKASHANA